MNERMESFEIRLIHASIVTLGGLQDHGDGMKAAIVDYGSEPFQPDFSLADMCMAIYMAAQIGFGVIQVDHGKR